MQNAVLEKMEKIKTLFQESKEQALQTNDLATFIIELDKVENEFRSVAYEAAAMAFAEQDLLAENTLTNWNLFCKKSEATYEVQLHVGLGWALAKENKETSALFNSLDPFMVPRVLDGMGYYDGVFRQRATIKNLKISDKFDSSDLNHYDQGVGRSIWYLAAGNPTKCSEIINTFPSERKVDLWRGIGIASVYVGGCDDATLIELKKTAKEYSIALTVGAALAIKSRVESNSVINDTESACKLLLRSNANELVEKLNTIRKESPGIAYNKWLAAIEQYCI